MSNLIETQARRLPLGATLALAFFLHAGGALGEPRILVSEDRWDFGNITATYPVGHVFTVKNGGDQPLIIDQVSAGCGCTTTSLSQHRIDPGKEVPLGLSFNPSTLAPGSSVQKTVTISCNDPQAQEKVVSIKAGLSYQGVAGIGIEPKWIPMGKGEGRRAVWKKIVLTNQLPAPIEVEVLAASGAVAQARLTRNRIPSRGRAELRLLVDGQKLSGRDPNKTSTGNSVTLAFTTERRDVRVTLPVATPSQGTETQAAGGRNQPSNSQSTRARKGEL